MARWIRFWRRTWASISDSRRWRRGRRAKMCHETCMCERCARMNGIARSAMDAVEKFQGLGQVLAARVKELEAENAELRKDKARLDWIERNHADIYESI